MLYGGNDDDLLRGGGGNDGLFAGSGDDTLIGGLGKDTLTGNSGADTFQFNKVLDSTATPSRDEVHDFNRAEGDVIDLSHIDANANTAGDDGFTLVASYSNTAGELRITTTGTGNSYIQSDINGDGTDDLRIFLTGVTAMSAGDFLL